MKKEQDCNVKSPTSIPWNDEKVINFSPGKMLAGEVFHRSILKEFGLSFKSDSEVVSFKHANLKQASLHSLDDHIQVGIQTRLVGRTKVVLDIGVLNIGGETINSLNVSFKGDSSILLNKDRYKAVCYSRPSSMGKDFPGY